MSTQNRDNAVGFIGLGQMGGPMAANILKKGHALVVCDIDTRKVDEFVGLGAQAADGPADLGRRASRIVSMVDTTAQAEQVIVGPAGIITTAQPGDVVISMSTIDPEALKKMREKLAAKGVELIDAPVSGMEKGAREGTLRAFVGGEAQALEKARPVLDAMCAEIIHFGAIGSGTTMKLLNNMLMQAGRVLVAEAMALGAKAGLDTQQMVDVIGKSTGNSVVFQYSAPRMVSRNFEGIRMDITIKDLELQTQLAKSLGMPMFIAGMAQQVYIMGRAAGFGSEDTSAVVKVYEQFTGVPVGVAAKQATT
ncbi:MAG TPA: NAD(P)-dependent oxidoreductase [Ramlibacter sp.]|nr:NAD(P)-dependent oxidoreductase [Ramlibacter sp.]